MVGALACGDAFDTRRELPAELAVEYSGPLASNREVPEPTVAVLVGALTIRAASVFDQTGYQLRARAYVREGDAPSLLRVVVSSTLPGDGLAVIAMQVYSVRVVLPAGTYTLQLVRVDDGGPERVELEQVVVVP